MRWRGVGASGGGAGGLINQPTRDVTPGSSIVVKVGAGGEIERPDGAALDDDEKKVRASLQHELQEIRAEQEREKAAVAAQRREVECSYVDDFATLLVEIYRAYPSQANEICPADTPTCIGYAPNKAWGQCGGGVPAAALALAAWAVATICDSKIRMGD